MPTCQIQHSLLPQNLAVLNHLMQLPPGKLPEYLHHPLCKLLLRRLELLLPLPLNLCRGTVLTRRELIALVVWKIVMRIPELRGCGIFLQGDQPNNAIKQASDLLLRGGRGLGGLKVRSRWTA